MTDDEPARVPETVLRSMNSNASGSPVLHIPHPSSDEDVYCSRLKREATEKDIECFPEPWRNWCGKCVRYQREALAVTDGGIPGAQKRSHYDDDAREDEPQEGEETREPTRYERAHTLILSCTDHMCTFRRPYRGEGLDDVLTDTGCLDPDKVPRRCHCGAGITEELYHENGEEVEVV